MVLTIAAVLLLMCLGSWEHAVIFVEAALLLEFAVYWYLQSAELWGDDANIVTT